MSLTKNQLLSLLFTAAVLGIAAWMMLHFASPAVSVADEGDSAVSEDDDESLNVAPKPRRRPEPVKNKPPRQPDPTPSSNSGPGSNGSPPSQVNTPSRSNSVPRTPRNSNSQPRPQVREYTETIQERNDRLIRETQTCADAARAAGIWNELWNDSPVVLMFIANSGVIPVTYPGKPGLATSNLRVWLHQIRPDEYHRLDRQHGQHGAWSPHYKVYSIRLPACQT